MKISIDTEAGTLYYEKHNVMKNVSLYSKESFELLSNLWTKVGWNEKYIYTFSWLGRPIIQLPEDMIRIQELIYKIQPDVIIETGVAHGGSLIYYASLCKAMDKGRVIGVDIEIRPHNKQAIREHPLSSAITLIEGDSVATDTIEAVKACIKPHDNVLILLDSCHTKEHVLSELRAYAPLVSVDSYIVATDGIMKDVYDTPRGEPAWKEDHPTSAALTFCKENDAYVIEQPSWPFNESDLTAPITHWPSAYIKRQKA
ncbi:cephalosporin hydroxylase [Fictibacillus macauensis ZFHKF-1]|uniref:Cephalosporin hydroxylase n=1 Tax=Fictibacillus macauensis ZFHKF-1 TaxID=1196324 RepID=I8UCW0_9BACL|nr:CmcI family methyltransferase [Fictibacillus macauensis]EIT84628.1 cephalosporin hydroxylase [Fictibacillus macauensis ZFHKF-1]